MIAALLLTAIAGIVVWLVFFKFRWLRFSYAWAFVLGFFGLHLLLVFLIGLRFVAPYTTDAKMVQHTIQLIPRLPEPTLVTAVLVEPNVPIKKGQALFQFDRSIYEDKVRQLEAELAAAQQNVEVMKVDIEAAAQKVEKLKSQHLYSEYQEKLTAGLVRKGAGREEDAQKWAATAAADLAAVRQAQAEQRQAQLRYASQINGVNTNVARVEAELAQARYYLDNTTMSICRFARAWWPVSSASARSPLLSSMPTAIFSARITRSISSM